MSALHRPHDGRRARRDVPVDDPWLPRVWAEDDGLHLDVRGLLPTLALAQTMQLVSRCGHGGPIVVHQHREPALLSVELALFGWWAERVPGDPGEVRMRLAARG
ncbi:MAG: hypothetical protein AMXMBFR66_32750 [Pseudomonadota bacterium]|nr:hypothetical protein [Rubrivivax sp.]